MPILNNNRETLTAAIAAVRETAQGNDATAFENAMMNFGNTIEQNVLAEYEALRDERDVAVLAARGVRQLTSEENKFYTAMATAASDKNPAMALKDMDVVMPQTIIEQVFDDLKTEHPLLDAINFVYGKGVTKWLVNTDEGEMATWGALTDEIVKEIASGFKEIDNTQNTLSAFLPIGKAMLELGPVWLDRYVRTALAEALALGLENGIVNGKGQTSNLHEPIGMMKDMSAAVDQSTGYKDKEAVAVTELTPQTMGALAARLTRTENGKPRKARNMILVVNPTDYLEKVMPATSKPLPGGGYTVDELPLKGCKIIQSDVVPSGKAVFGLGKKYSFVSGSPGGKDGFADVSDHCRFLQNQRVYLTALYGHGQPVDNNCFVVLDISGLKPLYYQVQVMDGAAATNLEA